MNNKIVPLLVIFAILIFAVMIKNSSQPKTDNLFEQAGVVKLLPENFLIADTAKVEIYSGANPEKKVVLSKDQTWYIESAYNAPADKAKIEDKLLKTLKDLNGEPRPAGKDILADYELEEKQALHIKIYHKNDKDKVYSHLLIGKKIQHNACFVRNISDIENVYRVGKGLYSEMGIWGDDKTPPSKHWLKSKILDIDKNKLTKLVLQYPDKKLAFVRVEKKPEKDKKDPKVKTPEEKPEYEWKLLEGGFGKKHKAIDSLLTSITAIKPDEVVDPKKKEKWALEQPQFRLEITLEDESEYEILAGVPEVGKDSYCMLADKPNLIYKVPHWKFTDVFKKGENFFEMPSLKFDKAQIKEIKLTRPEGSVVMERYAKGDKQEDIRWNLLSPNTPLAIQKETAEDIARNVCSITLDDYSDEDNPAVLGLVNPDYQVDVKMRDGSIHSIKGGNASPVIEGRYVMLDDQRPLGAIGKYDAENIFPDYTELFTLEPLNLPSIQRVQVSYKENEYILSQQEIGWQLQSGGQSHSADKEKVKKMLEQFVPLKVATVAFQHKQLEGKKTIATVTIKAEEKQYQLFIYDQQERQYPLIISGDSAMYYVKAEIVDAILQQAQYYQLAEPEETKPEETKPEETKPEEGEQAEPQ